MKKKKKFQPRQTPLTSCPGYCQLKFTSTSGSPRTVQITWMPSLTSALLDDATIVVEGGPLGTYRKTVLRNWKSVSEVKHINKTYSRHKLWISLLNTTGKWCTAAAFHPILGNCWNLYVQSFIRYSFDEDFKIQWLLNLQIHVLKLVF